jgi:formylglycine-generating enzyme required for sulfatase activity
MEFRDMLGVRRNVEPVEGSLTVDIGGGVNMELVPIRPGRFVMGSTEEELHLVREKWAQVKEHYISGERPAHSVTIAGGLYMGRYEVTQEQWEAVMDSNPSIYRGSTLAVQASWDDSQEFLKRLSETTGRRFTLPSEAEWEYACRAGSTTMFHFGDDAGDLKYYAHMRSFSGRVRPVGGKKPNTWGLYNMIDNVMEWCEDVWHEDYEGAPQDGSPWLDGGKASFRVLRGASWDSSAYWRRSASRFGYFPDIKACSGIGGLRVVLREHVPSKVEETRADAAGVD